MEQDQFCEPGYSVDWIEAAFLKQNGTKNPMESFECEDPVQPLSSANCVTPAATPAPSRNTRFPSLPNSPSDLDLNKSPLLSATPASVNPKPRHSTKKNRKSDQRILNADGETQISLNYSLYIAAEEEVSSTRGSHKQKVPPSDRKVKYTQIKSRGGDIYFFWDLGYNNLTAFKQAALGAIREHNTGVFADHAELQDAARRVVWNATVPHGGAFQSNNRANINTNQRFTQFLDESANPLAYKISISINEINPKLVAEREAAKEKLEGSQTKKKRYGNDWEPLSGATHSSNMFDLIALIKATHPPQGKLTGFHEVNVYINPKDPKQYMILNIDRLTVWAKAIMKSDSIDVYNLPNVPGFDWEKSRPTPPLPSLPPIPPPVQSDPIPVQNTPVQPAAAPATFPIGNGPQVYVAWNPVVGQMMAYTVQPNSPAQFQPTQLPQPVQLLSNHMSQPPQLLTTQVPQPPSSPAPVDENLLLDDYLRFAHVNPSCAKLQEDLDSLGINHYSKLSNFTPDELVMEGFKKGDAGALISNLKKYEHHLKKQRVNVG